MIENTASQSSPVLNPTNFNILAGLRDRAIHSGVQRPVYYSTPSPFLVQPGPATSQPSQPAPGTSTADQTQTTTPQSVYGNEQLEYPAPWNIPPSTNPDAYIDPTTGQVVSPTVSTSFLSGITAWIQANPWLSLAIAAGAVYLLMGHFGGKHRR